MAHTKSRNKIEIPAIELEDSLRRNETTRLNVTRRVYDKYTSLFQSKTFRGIAISGIMVVKCAGRRDLAEVRFYKGETLVHTVEMPVPPD